MKRKILACSILVLFFIFLSPIVKAAESETITPLADAFVDLVEVDSPHGKEDYLAVSEHPTTGLFSITLLMFDISHISNVPSEVKLRLYCLDRDSPHVVGVHWYVNNTWNEENLTRDSYQRIFTTIRPEDAVVVDSKDVWYEWGVTGFVREAMEEDYDRISFTLEVEDTLKGVAVSYFASREMFGYSPQLVFIYNESGSYSPSLIFKAAAGLAVIVVVVFLAFRFLRRRPREKRRKVLKRGRKRKKPT